MASTFVSAGAPPAGVIPNFVDPPDSLYSGIVVTSSLILALTTTFTVARLVARKATSRFMIDDYLLLIAWALNVVYNGILIWQARVGIGRHVWDVTAVNALFIAKQSWAIELEYCPLMWTAKASLLFQLQRTFAPTKIGVVYVTTQILIWGNFAFYFSLFLAVLFECVPQAKIWDPLISGGYCLNRDALMVAAGIVNLISDVAIFILPFWAIWKLHTALKYKLGVAAIFFTGLIAVAASLGRVISTIKSLTDTDSTYVIAEIALWTLSEIASIILCICFPMMPRFLMVLLRKDTPLSGTDRGRHLEQATNQSLSVQGQASREHGSPDSQTSWHIEGCHKNNNSPNAHHTIRRTVSIEQYSLKDAADVI